MSKFTTTVRFICVSLLNLQESQGYNNINQILQESAPLLFDFDFPIFDEAYRLPLEIKILRHFYTREICEETVGLWKLRLEDKLNLIMPYYNQLYKSELIAFNPLYDVDITTDHQLGRTGNESRSENTETTNTTETAKESTQVVEADQSNTNTNTGSSNGTTANTTSGQTHNESTNWDLFSDTPQGGIDVITNDTDGVSKNTYLTDVRKITDDSNGTSSGTNNTQTTQTTTITDTGTSTTDSTTTNDEDTTIQGHGTSERSGETSITNNEQYIEHIRGKQGGKSYAAMLNEFRKTMLNIDMQVINDLNDLFFHLWE